ncbi:cobaltochelatase CobT-related protein [Elstera cyanobacteriorum]|uniref:cobaltochelatase CobT-related protein n=1 Tax=Elstera cyanobacteriorum TaxID=2022747 RepID=UPI00235654EB|nr:VWA domain-containing protein [Elstera cyanobacteriorum]MCK6444685.1 VWA domain-containing protein [Elstera cyanobacteriorum]
MVPSPALLSCLPLLAASLGHRHGVTVEIGGPRAYTDGRVIRLPDLPTSGDPRFLGLVRGYIDHEAAHIRFTDFDLLRREQPDVLEKYVWNILEDWRIEDRLAKLYPGCGENFRALIQELFLDAPRPKLPKTQWFLDWLLLTVRAWRLPALAGRVRRRAGEVERVIPGLLDRVTPILERMRQHCPDSAACLDYAREIIALWMNTPPDDPNADPQPLRSSDEADLPEDIAAILRRCLRASSKEPLKSRTSVAVMGDKPVQSLTDLQLADSRRLTSGLKARLTGLLQASILKRVARSRRGKLDPKLLANLATGSPRIFRQGQPKPGLNTAVHLLLDTSGSMRERISLAGHLAHAVAEALYGVGLPLAVTAFPGRPQLGTATYVPLLDYGDRPHARFLPNASGDTPLTQVLWAVLQQISRHPEPRQILLLLTDGEPDDPETAKDALATAARLGVEVYALGIKAPSITSLLPTTSQNIDTLDALPEALFQMLQRALIRRKS